MWAESVEQLEPLRTSCWQVSRVRRPCAEPSSLIEAVCAPHPIASRVALVAVSALIGGDCNDSLLPSRPFLTHGLNAFPLAQWPFFLWVNPLFAKRGDISHSSLPRLDPSDRTIGMTAQLEVAWETSRKSANGDGKVSHPLRETAASLMTGPGATQAAVFPPSAARETFVPPPLLPPCPAPLSCRHSARPSSPRSGGNTFPGASCR